MDDIDINNPFEIDAVWRCARWDDLDWSCRERNAFDKEQSRKAIVGDMPVSSSVWMEPESELDF